MPNMTPYLAVAATLLATACVAEVEPEREADAYVAPDTPGEPVGDETGSAPFPCGHDLVLDENGKPVQVPVLCDPMAERLPDLGEEELIDEGLLHQEVEAPVGQPGY